MTPNMSGGDRAIHLLIGAGLFALAFVGPKEPAGFLGLLPIFSGVTGFEPIYRLLGRTTIRKAKASPYGRYLRQGADKRTWRESGKPRPKTPSP